MVSDPLSDPLRVLAEERERSAGELVDVTRLHCLWLRQLEERLREVGLDYESRKIRTARIALSMAADACLTDTARIDVGDDL